MCNSPGIISLCFWYTERNAWRHPRLYSEKGSTNFVANCRKYEGLRLHARTDCLSGEHEFQANCQINEGLRLQEQTAKTEGEHCTPGSSRGCSLYDSWKGTLCPSSDAEGSRIVEEWGQSTPLRECVLSFIVLAVLPLSPVGVGLSVCNAGIFFEDEGASPSRSMRPRPQVH